MESETDESGYGDTCTQHASSFDTGMDYSQEDLLSAMSVTPRGAQSYAGYDSDGTESYKSDYRAPLDPEDQRDVACQTPGYAQTQTPPTFLNSGISMEDLQTSFRTMDALKGLVNADGSREIQTQTGDSDAASSSGSKKKKKKKRLRSEMLKGILAEVKSIKAEKGLDSSASEMETDAASVSSYRSGRPQDAAVNGTSPSKPRRSLFTGESQTNPSRGQSPYTSQPSTYPSETTATIPLVTPRRPQSAASVVMSPPPIQEQLYLPQQRPTLATGATPNLLSTYPQPSYGRRPIGADDVEAVHRRLDALRNYELPPRALQPPVNHNPAQQMTPQGFTATQMGLPMWTPVVPAYIVKPPPAKIKKHKSHPRYHVRDFTRSYDDIDLILSDSDGGHRSRRRDRRMSRVIDSYHLDDALFEAAVASRQLKKLSQKMKNSLRDEILKG